MTTDLVSFLRARIAQDRTAAQAAMLSGNWHLVHYNDPINAEHGHRWNPARALSECDAKDRLIALYEVSGSAELPPEAWVLLRSAVAGLALPYINHPDCRQEWMTMDG